MASHHFCELYADQVAGTIWIELGADRDLKEEGSTIFLQNLASKHDSTFISVDVEQVSISSVVVQSDAIDFCKNFDFRRNLGLVYLDNFDWMWHPQKYRDCDDDDHKWLESQIADYRKNGVEMNNIESSLVHLKQISALDNAWADKAVIVMDDTWFDHTNDVFCGKGNAAIYYLLQKNWKVLNGSYNETYVVIGKNIEHRGSVLFDIDALNKRYGRVWKNL